MNQEKLKFLTTEYFHLLEHLPSETPALFGKMNVQQMIEHMSYSIRFANGKDRQTLVTPEDKLDAMKKFIMSEKDFRPNTPNSMLGDTPEPLKNRSKEEALNELKAEIADFVKHFEANPGALETNPFFGHLNYAEWVQGLHKHAIHHLRQFGVVI